MISAVLLCVLFCACVLLRVRARIKESRAHPLPPAYPGELSVIGHLHLLLTDTTSLWLTLKSLALDTMKQGGVTHGKIGSDIYYLITDPEDALTVANTCLQKHFLYSFAQNWLGQGLITGSGEIWQRHRKLLNPVFSVPVIHGFLEVFNSQSRIMLNIVEPYVGRGKFDPTAHMRKMTLGMSCLTAFGATDVKDKVFYSKYMKAVDEILHLITQRFQKFWLHSEFIYKLLGLKKKELELVKTLNGISNEIIQSKKAALINRASHKIPADTTYSPLLDLIMKQTSKSPLTDQEIREEIDTTIVAGFETSSHLLVCILVLLGSHSEVQEKLYEELMQVLGEDKDVEKEDLQKLVYTDAVIKETLRVIPIVPVIGRYVDRDVKLKNYTLRADSQCFIFPFGMHRHPSWGADVEQFKPERWLDPATLPKNSNTFAVFSFGKRSCLGRTYAMTSAKVVIAHIVRKFQLTADHTKLQFKLDVTLKPIAGHEISLQRRN